MRYLSYLRAVTALAVGGFLAFGPLTITPARAMSANPMVAEITLAGAGSSARIEVGNEGADPLPFETHITRIEFDTQGQPHETPADDDFLVFPPQGVVAARSSQTVRVQWLGDPNLGSSRSYYLEIRQLPVQLAPESGTPTRPTVNVQIVYRIKALITVAPRNAKSKVSVVSIEPEMVTPHQPVKMGPGFASKPPPGQPEPGLKVTVKNVGNRHALMGGVNWLLSGVGTDGKPFQVTIPGDVIARGVGAGYLAPDGGVRIFDLPFDPPHTGALTLRFTDR
jgi:fimbrial chaperone protein